MKGRTAVRARARGDVRGTLVALGAALALGMGLAVSLDLRGSPTSARDGAAPADLPAAAPIEPAPATGSESSPERRQAAEVAVDDAHLPVAEGPRGTGALTFEIQAYRGERPVPGCRAWLVAGAFRELPGDPRAPGGAFPVRRAEGDDDGLMRFDGLEPGVYRARVEIGDLEVEQAVRMTEGHTPVRMGVRLGTATIEGFVRDAHGTPLARALVHLSQPGYGRNPPPYECLTHTDENGFYRFESVLAGMQVVSVHASGSLIGQGPRRELLVSHDDVVTADFGPPGSGAVTWRGVLRNSGRQPVPGPGEIRVRDEERQVVRTEHLQADGSFHLTLQPGKHHVWVQPAGFFPRVVDLGVHDVPVSDWSQDLELPGARLVLHPVLPDGSTEQPEITLRRVQETLSVLQLAAQPDGTWVHDGLEPGDYVLSIGGLVFEESGGPELAFTLPPDRERLDLDVHLRAGR